MVFLKRSTKYGRFERRRAILLKVSNPTSCRRFLAFFNIAWTTDTASSMESSNRLELEELIAIDLLRGVTRNSKTLGEQQFVWTIHKIVIDRTGPLRFRYTSKL